MFYPKPPTFVVKSKIFISKSSLNLFTIYYLLLTATSPSNFKYLVDLKLGPNIIFSINYKVCLNLENIRTLFLFY